jgi:hypothetical protein
MDHSVTGQHFFHKAIALTGRYYHQRPPFSSISLKQQGNQEICGTGANNFFLAKQRSILTVSPFFSPLD